MLILQRKFTHPELAKGEIFFTNASRQVFKKISWQTKRMGSVAYNGEGKKQINKNWYPVFISVDELEETGKTLREARMEHRKKFDN